MIEGNVTKHEHLLKRFNIFALINMKNSPLEINAVGNINISHFPTVNTDDISSSVVSLLVYNITVRELFTYDTQPEYDESKQD